jgi:hypothetical protein
MSPEQTLYSHLNEVGFLSNKNGTYQKKKKKKKKL